MVINKCNLDYIAISDKNFCLFTCFSGLYFGAIFQVVCIAAVIFLKDNSKTLNHDSDTESSEISPQVRIYRYCLQDMSNDNLEEDKVLILGCYS